MFDSPNDLLILFISGIILFFLSFYYLWKKYDEAKARNEYQNKLFQINVLIQFFENPEAFGPIDPKQFLSWFTYGVEIPHDSPKLQKALLVSIVDLNLYSEFRIVYTGGTKLSEEKTKLLQNIKHLYHEASHFLKFRSPNKEDTQYIEKLKILFSHFLMHES